MGLFFDLIWALIENIFAENRPGPGQSSMGESKLDREAKGVVRWLIAVLFLAAVALCLIFRSGPP